MEWLNEPPVWNDSNGVITMTAAPKSDFWRLTHYGFIRDNGHFYYREVEGNFTAQVKITGKYQALYDQAGFMLRLNEMEWLKTGIEFVEGVQQASAVVTHNYSDWSVVPLPQNPPSLWLKLKREAEAIEISYSQDGENYQLLRLTHFSTAPKIMFGLMCAAPDGDGFEVQFEDFVILN
jgi:uncharacterized protein